MKFLVDAQLPHRLVRQLTEAGHDAIHTQELPAGNRTPDIEINARALAENRVVVTKDRDFVTTFLLRKQPSKLLLISTGNIPNDALSRLLAANLADLETALVKYSFVELSSTAITIHS